MSGFPSSIVNCLGSVKFALISTKQPQATTEVSNSFNF